MGPRPWRIPLLLALLLCRAPEVHAQTPACREPLATVTVSSSNYARVNAQAFEGRLFVYAPPLGSRPGSQPFDLWVVQGIYGPPFLRNTGTLPLSEFNKVRATSNVRAVAIRVQRGDGSEGTSFRMGRNSYQARVLAVSAGGGGSVRIQFCR